MSDMKWGITRPRLDLLLCSIGIHKFSIHCASSHHGRDTKRECFCCGYFETRTSKDHVWGNNGPWFNPVE